MLSKCLTQKMIQTTGWQQTVNIYENTSYGCDQHLQRCSGVVYRQFTGDKFTILKTLELWQIQYTYRPNSIPFTCIPWSTETA